MLDRAQAGALGGTVTAETYGRRYMRRLGAKGGARSGRPALRTYEEIVSTSRGRRIAAAIESRVKGGSGETQRRRA